VGPHTESGREVPVRALALHRPAKAWIGRDQQQPVAVAAGSDRPGAPPTWFSWGVEEPAEQERWLSLMAELCLRATRDALQQGVEHDHDDFNEGPP
jgi:hypothetical protein